MKIAYVVSGIDLSVETGVLKKIVGQIRAWQDAGCEVQLFTTSPGPEVCTSARSIPVEITLCQGRWERLLKIGDVVRKTFAWQPDLVYHRFHTHYLHLERLLARIPTVLEINTDDVVEYRRLMYRYEYIYHCLMRNRILRRAAGMVFVTQELAQRYQHYNKPSIVLGNGIDLAHFPTLPPTQNARPRLVFIGVGNGVWHGTEKVVEMAQHNPEWDLDLIGYTSADLPAPLPANLKPHGLLNRNEYQPLLACADIGLGTLALHNKRMEEASPLKVREYMAYGLPAIIGYMDTDFVHPVPFLLQLPNTPTNIRDSQTQIRAFVTSWKGRRVPRTEVAHLDNSYKERERLALFAQILNTCPNRSRT